MVVVTGMGMILAAATPGVRLMALSPVLMLFLLMRVSGVTLLEEGLKASKPGYPRAPY
jgi:steroid 5-alpha reductase family enzyme